LPLFVIVKIRAGPRHRPGVRRPRALAGRGPSIKITIGGVCRNILFLGGV